MGAKDNTKPHKPSSHQNENSHSPDSSSDQSNQTLPLPALHQLSLEERPSQTSLKTQHQDQKYSFLKGKPIRKRNRHAIESKDKIRNKLEKAEMRIKELQKQLQEYKTKENACPHCHFYLNSQPPQLQTKRSLMTPQPLAPTNCFKRSNSRDSLEFEQIDFMTPLMCSPEMQEKSWVFLGTVMIAMGSKVTDMDGTMNVFKVVKESVDNIRRQVQKSEEKLSMNFFLSKQELMLQNKMDQLDYDPFYTREGPARGLQLQGVRVESVQQFELCFDQKLNFNVKYDALITAMQYLKENSNISFS